MSIPVPLQPPGNVGPHYASLLGRGFGVSPDLSEPLLPILVVELGGGGESGLIDQFLYLLIYLTLGLQRC